MYLVGVDAFDACLNVANLLLARGECVRKRLPYVWRWGGQTQTRTTITARGAPARSIGWITWIDLHASWHDRITKFSGRRVTHLQFLMI